MTLMDELGVGLFSNTPSKSILTKSQKNKQICVFFFFFLSEESILTKKIKKKKADLCLCLGL